MGFRHLIAGDVLVAHARSASFGDERRARLGRQGMAVLRQRYPDYEDNVGATLYSFARRVLDYRVRRIYADADHAPLPRPRMLVIASDVDAATLFAESHGEAFDCLVTANGSGAETVFANDESIRSWLVEQAVEYIAVIVDRPSNKRLQIVSAELSIAFIECDASRTDLHAAARDAWLKVSAIGHVNDASGPTSCL